MASNGSGARARLLASVAIPVALMAASAAWAEEAPASGATVDEIVVTALKRSQTLTSVPASISALDADALADRGISTVNDIQQQTPSVSFGTALGTTQVSIRGVGLTIATGAGEPGVAVHLDGFYEARPALSGLAQFDLERVEVLRGPQGTLYGRNATGGAINFISKAPTQTFEARAAVGYAEYDEFHVEGVVSGPLSDRVRGRLGATFTERDQGFIENVAPGQDDLDKTRTAGVRGRLEVDLSEDAVLDLQLTYLRSDGSTIYLTPTQPLDPATVAFNPALATALVETSPDKTAISTPRGKRTAIAPVATLNWELGELDFKSITGFSKIESESVSDSDGTSAEMGYLPQAYDSQLFTQEFGLTGTTGKLDWIVGAYYLNERYEAYQDVVFPNGFTAAFPIPGVGIIPIPVYGAGERLLQHWSEKRESYAAFADGTYRITDSFSLFAGARYSKDKFRLTQTVGTLLTGLACDNLTNEETFSSFTPRVGAQYTPSFGGNLYGSVSRGYKSGGLNFGTCNDPYDPEKVTAYEIGYKGRLAGNTVTYGIAAFYYDYEDLQVYQLRPITAGGGSYIDNAPKATIQGIEGDLTWRPTANLEFNAGLSFLDATYDEYVNADSSILGSAPEDLSGNRIPKSPEFTGNIGAQYTTDMIDGVGRFTVRAEAYHSAEQYYTEFNKPQDGQDAYTVYNAFVKWDDPSDRYSVRLYGRNLGDERYFNFVTATPLSGTTLVTYAPPRQIGVELAVSF